jgi:hypothetical protein
MLATANRTGNTPVSKATAAANHVAESLPVQRQLSVGKEGGGFEQEADAMDSQVMTVPEKGFIQRKCAECEEEEKAQRKPLPQSITPFIQTKSNGDGAVSSAVSGQIQSSRGNGTEMDSSTKSFMNSRFASDFSRVQIHTDSQSVQLNQDLNARAFTVGNDIYFNQGQYRPQSPDGKKLLAHELTHVQQQDSGIIRRCVNPEKNDPLYDAIAKQIKAKPAYTALADKAAADGIMTEAKKRGACIYYIGKLKALFDTPEKASPEVAAENKAVTVEAVKQEKARVAKPAAAKNLDVEKKAADAVPAANWKDIAGKFGGGTYQVDNTNPANIIVKVKIFLKKEGTGTDADVDAIKQMHDGIEKAVAAKGFIVSIEFLDAAAPGAFEVKVHHEGWTTATNWSAATPKTLAHEMLHLLAFPIDRYNYIESHSTNQSMLIPDRLTWFRIQMDKPPGFDNPLSIMASGEHPLEDDVCTVAGLDVKTCMAARQKAAKP